MTEARNCLSEMDDLANRMKNLMSIEIDRNELNDEEYKAELIESIMTNMWRFNQTYNFLTTQMVSLTVDCVRNICFLHLFFL